MLPRIFERIDDKIVLTDDILRIPILNRLWQKYGDTALDMLSVIDYYCDVQGVYNNYEEESKLQNIIEDLELGHLDLTLNYDFTNVLCQFRIRL